MQKAIKSPASKLNSACSAFSVAEDLLIFSEICEISVKKTTFLCKTKPIFGPFSGPKITLTSLTARLYRKIYIFVESQKQTQFKPNSKPIKPNL